MASLKEIKTRIASVNSTRKITSAMKMVASSKLHHAQVAIQNMLPYENLLEHILKSFLVSTPEATSLFEQRHNEVKRVALVVYPIGRKVAERVQKRGWTSAGDFVALADKPNARDCALISQELTRKYAAHEIDKVELVYHHFKSAGSQILTRRTFLPIDLSTEKIGVMNDRDLTSNVATAKAQEYLRKRDKQRQHVVTEAKPLNDNFLVEPNLEYVLQALVPKLLNLMVYTALLDSIASEHAARMVAMQTATDNADELLRQLRLQYNKSRQAAITSELLDIVGGSVNN